MLILLLITNAFHKYKLHDYTILAPYICNLLFFPTYRKNAHFPYLVIDYGGYLLWNPGFGHVAASVLFPCRAIKGYVPAIENKNSLLSVQDVLTDSSKLQYKLGQDLMDIQYNSYIYVDYHTQ